MSFYRVIPFLCFDWLFQLGFHDGSAGSVEGFWSAAAGPYLVQGAIQVGSDKTLTIQAGTVVKFVSNSGISVYGNLVSQGTANDPVYFTSLLDSTLGGDTRPPGTTTPPAAGDWDKIEIRADSGQVYLHHLVIRYAGGNERGVIRVYGGPEALIEDCEIGDCLGPAILVSATSTIQNNFIHHCADGITISSVYTSVGYPAVTISNNRLEDLDRFPILIDLDYPFPTIGENALARNGAMGVGLKSGPEKSVALPIVTMGGQQVPYILDRLTVPEGIELTLPAGAVFKLDSNSILCFHEQPKLLSTSESPIVFTSLFDDSALGDTNSDLSATSAAAGDWGRVEFDFGDNFRSLDLHDLVFRYGGADESSGGVRWQPALEIQSASPCTLTRIEIEQSVNGVFLRDTQAAFSDCHLHHNTEAPCISRMKAGRRSARTTAFRTTASRALESVATSVAIPGARILPFRPFRSAPRCCPSLPTGICTPG